MRIGWMGGVLGAVLGIGAAEARAGEVALARDLALSPAGDMLALSWAGDIWTVPAEGGLARRLTVHPAEDTHPVWSRDGRQIAFASRRHGSACVFVMNQDGTDVRRLTFADQNDYPSGFSADDAWVLFHAQREGDVYNEARMYRVPVAGGAAWRLLDCFGSQVQENDAGTRYMFARGGLPWVRWSRRHYRGSGNIDLWRYDKAAGEFTQLTDFDGTDRSPCWDGLDQGVYFLSDRDGIVNVWHQPLAGGEARQITFGTDTDVRDLTVSGDGRTLAYAQWDQVFVMSLGTGQTRRIEIRAGEDATQTDVDLMTLARGADEAEPSPDGKEIALVVRGELFVIKTEDDRPTRRVTHAAARDQHVTWSPDGKALFFVSDVRGQEDIYRAVSAEEPARALSDSLRFKVEPVTDSPELEYAPRVSPDGEKLAYLRTRGDLVVRDVKTGAESVLLESWGRPGYAWSPDSKWIAYSVPDDEHNHDIWVVPADGSAAAVNISQHPDNDHDPQWSADGQMLAFTSRREGFDSDLYLVFLSAELNEKSSVELDKYFERQEEKVKKRKPLKSAAASGAIALAGVAASQPVETQPVESQPAETQPSATQPVVEAVESTESAAGQARAAIRRFLQALLEEPKEEPVKPVKKKATKGEEKKEGEKEEKDEAEEKDEYSYELETCWERIRRVTSLPANQSRFAFSPDGQLLAFVSSHEGDAKLFTVKWNGQDRKQIMGSGVEGLQWGLDGKKLYYLKGGVPGSVGATGAGAESHGFAAKMAVSYAAEAAQKFDDGARQLGLQFYHPTMKGLDWPALTAKYRAWALRTRTVEEFNEIFNMLLGELNASHLGIYGPSGGERERVGYLGVAFDPSYDGPGLKVARVLERSPADRAESRLYVGDVVLRVDGELVGRARSVEEVLVDAVGDEVILEIEPSAARLAAEAKEAASQPATQPTSQPATQPTSQAASQASGSAVAGADEVVAEVPAAQAAEGSATQPAARELVIRPISAGSRTGLVYRAWVRENARYVDEKSGGRLGYLHIRGMDEGSFETFERDLYAAAYGKDGLIIDVRSNGGGWTADWVMAVLSVKRHAYTVQRGGQPGYPQDRLIFYAWTKPATMMCNHQSFSNAEIVSHAFKNTGRGPLVGMTTFGGVISTGGYRLIDGAWVRMPGRGWFTLPDGVDMENHGAEPDVKVRIEPADEVAGRKPQLDAAIAATLAQLGPPTGGE